MNADNELVDYSKKMKKKPKASDLFDGMVGDLQIPVYITEKASEINQIQHLEFCLKRDKLHSTNKEKEQ